MSGTAICIPTTSATAIICANPLVLGTCSENLMLVPPERIARLQMLCPPARIDRIGDFGKYEVSRYSTDDPNADTPEPLRRRFAAKLFQPVTFGTSKVRTAPFTNGSAAFVAAKSGANILLFI